MALSNGAPSLSPSTMPPPGTLKRPRAGGAAAAGGSASSTATAPRPKRRKPEGSMETEEGGPRGRSGVGMLASQVARAAEDDEDGEVVTKIDFRDLPVEALYKYLEAHDLLPTWQPSPWSEKPCIPPHLLYSAVPLPAAPISAASPRVLSPMAPPTEADEPMSADPSTSVPAMPTTQTDSSETQYQPLSGTIDDEAAPEDADMQDVEPEAPAAPTTRSKTLPRRRPPTPTPPPVEVNLGVMTLSDVLTARDVLAEKANAHWIKGLGGGQNKESETIVNFLYKMKVGPGKLLRVLKTQPNAGILLYTN